MKFADIPGHEDIKDELREMADSGRLPHALLLEGPSGSAKFMLARAYAQYIHCEDRSGGDSCGRCPSCLQHQSFNHIDTVFSFPVIKKNSRPTISDDYGAEFREMMAEYPYMDIERWIVALQSANSQPRIYVEEGAELQRRLNFKAHQSRFKIVLMWLPERLQEDTANKLLKLIEEPHEDTLFVLSSDDSKQILPTIYSRCRRIGVKRYDDATVARIIASRLAMSDESAAAIAALAAGNVNEALALVDVSHSRQQYLDLFIELMRKAYQRKIVLLRKWSADVAALGREKNLAFLDYCSRMIRENFILNLHIDGLNCLTDAERAFCVNFSRFINETNVLRIVDVFDDARNDIAANANAKIVMFDVAVKTILLLKRD